jgi:hypothetical protein
VVWADTVVGSNPGPSASLWGSAKTVIQVTGDLEPGAEQTE